MNICFLQIRLAGTGCWKTRLELEILIPINNESDEIKSVSRSPRPYRLAGLVVKASASRAEGPGFESRLRRDFFGVESYQ